MEKRVYLQPETKILSVGVHGDVCETQITVTSDDDSNVTMYGPPGIFDESPLF